MDHLKIIQEYLRKAGGLDLVPATSFPFVTISRQAAAGGHLLSYVIITDFLKQSQLDLFKGWQVFDREFCETIARDPELQTSIEELVGEEYESEFSDFMEGLFIGHSRQYRRYQKVFRIIRVLAMVGKAVIVGRASALVTRDLPGGIHIRLVASLPTRIGRMMKKLKVSKDEAKRLIAKHDSERRRMVHSFFGRDIDDPLLYDAVWNTDTADLHEISHSVAEMLKFRTARLKKAGA